MIQVPNAELAIRAHRFQVFMHASSQQHRRRAPLGKEVLQSFEVVFPSGARLQPLPLKACATWEGNLAEFVCRDSNSSR